MNNQIVQRMSPINPEYKKIQGLVQLIVDYQGKMRQNLWQIALILHKIQKGRLYAKAGYYSMQHFLYSVQLTKAFLLVAALPEFMTEGEFNMVGQTKAKLMIKFLRAFPDAKTEVFTIAAASPTVHDMRVALQKKYPVGNDILETYSLLGTFEEINAIREMVNLLMSSGEYGNKPIEVVEHCLVEHYQEVMSMLNKEKKYE